jgi:hypothetical protein
MSTQTTSGRLRISFVRDDAFGAWFAAARQHYFCLVSLLAAKVAQIKFPRYDVLGDYSRDVFREVTR